MGLASKLNAAGAGGPPGGAPPGGSYQGGPPPGQPSYSQGPQPGQRPGAPPGQPQYSAYTGGPSQMAGYPNYPPPWGNQSHGSYSQQPPGYGAYSQPQSTMSSLQNPTSAYSTYNRPPPPPPGQQQDYHSSYSRPPPAPPVQSQAQYSHSQPYQQSYQPSAYPQQSYQQSYQQPYSQPYPPQAQPQQAMPYDYYSHGPPGGYAPPSGPPPGQYGGPPPPQQSYGGPPQGYGAPSGGPQETQAYKSALERAIQEKGLQQFFSRNPQALDIIASKASAKVNQICQQWKIPTEVGRDLARLGLYDIILYVDDSGSMQFEEGGERIDDLKLILNRVVQASTLFDDDGISIRFMNTVLPEGMGDNVRSEQQINQIMSSVKFAGLTPMGRELRKKVIDGIVLRDARLGRLNKPVLVIAVTDGQPAGDEPSATAVFETIRYAVSEVGRATGSNGGISFQFAQVGNDTKAREFLGKLDSDPMVGNMVDCTSNYEQEQQEMLNQNPPVDLTPELWLIKLLLGSIDPSYDSKDEQRSYRPSGPQHGGPPPGGPPGGYGAPPGPPGGGYGGLGPGGYHAPPGPPPGRGGGPGQPPYPNQPPYPQGGGYSQPPPPPRY